MARVEINFPERIIYAMNISVRITDLNYGGHLGNDRLLSLLHEARVDFLRAMNYTEKNIEGTGIIMSDAAISYKAEAFFGDNLLIQISAGDFGRAGFDLYYRVMKNEIIIAIAKTGIVFYDYAAGKVVSMPELFRRQITGMVG